jgi:hypothetical protein
MLLDGHRPARVVVRNRIFVEATYRDLLYTPLPGDVPDLNDPVTVNALLLDGWVFHNSFAWVANIRPCTETGSGDTRTEAICRAWIAAQGKKS